MQKHSVLFRTASFLMAWSFFVNILSPSFFSIPKTFAAANDYSVTGGDPSSLPRTGDASVPLGLITLTDVDGDDFSNMDMTELLRVQINTTDYANVAFDNTVGPVQLTIGGTCGHTSAMSLSFSDAHTADIIVTGAGGFGTCDPGQTITIDGLKIKTTGHAIAPAATHLITVDNVFTSSGSPVASSTLVSYPIPAPDAQATMTFSTPVIGSVGNATLSLTLPSPLSTNDTVVITFPGHFNLSGINMATTGTLGGANSFNCTSFGNVATCNASGVTNTTGTIILTGIIATAASAADVTVKVANQGNINNLIAEDATVPTTDIIAPTDNVVTDISVQDANKNGKLDRVVVTVDNNSLSSAFSHSTAGWNVTNGGNNVTIANVTIDGAANANPLKINVNLDENDTDLSANVTSTNTIELTYTPQAANAGFEFDDLSDIQLSTITAGDTDASNTENDGAAPILVNWNYNTSNNKINMQWSEDVILGTLQQTKLTVQNAPTATLSHTLIGGTAVADSTSALTLTPHFSDIVIINSTPDLLKNMSTSYLRLATDFIKDNANNPSVAILDGQALQAQSVTIPPVTMITTGGGGGGASGNSNSYYNNYNSNVLSFEPDIVSNGNGNGNTNSLHSAAPDITGTITLSTYKSAADNVEVDITLKSSIPIPPQSILTFTFPAGTSLQRIHILDKDELWPYTTVVSNNSISYYGTGTTPSQELHFKIQGIKNGNSGTYTIPVTVKPSATETPLVANDNFDTITLASNTDLRVSGPVETLVESKNSIIVPLTNTNGNSNTNAEVQIPLTGPLGQIKVLGDGGQITIQSNTNVITSGSWNGIIHAPTNANINSLPQTLSVSNENTNSIITKDQINKVVTIGSPRVSLQFDIPVTTTLSIDKDAFTVALQKEIATAVNVNQNRIAVTSIVDVMHIDENSNTATTVSSNTITVVPCSGSSCDTNVINTNPVVLKNNVGNTCATKPGPKLSEVATSDSSHLTTFIFGRHTTVTDTGGNTNTITRQGFGTGRTQNTPTRTPTRIPKVSISTEICHFSTYAIVVRSISVVPLESLNIYSDVEANHPSVNAINSMKSEQIMTGYSDGNFRPETSVNRAEFLKTLIVAKYGNINASEAQDCFTDVKKDAWYARYVCFAKDKKIISGYADGSFGPEQNINLAEATKILVETLQVEKSATTRQEWYGSYLDTMASLKAIPTSFSAPTQTVDRGNLAEMVWRIQQKIDYLEGAEL